MNERIDELAFAAGCHRHKYWDPKHPDLEGFIINQAALDKFAELIVRECMDIVSDESEKVSDEWRCKDGKHIWWKIKEHFGVEE